MVNSQVWQLNASFQITNIIYSLEVLVAEMFIVGSIGILSRKVVL